MARLASVVAVAAAAVLPDGLSEPPFNASAFELQLPVSDGRSGVQTIGPAALHTYSSKYFTVNGSDGSATLFCPVNGAHTSGSKYPRTELREATMAAVLRPGKGTAAAMKLRAASAQQPSVAVVVGRA